MNAKVARKLRKSVKKDDMAFLAKFSETIKLMTFGQRAKLAVQIVFKTFGKPSNV